MTAVYHDINKTVQIQHTALSKHFVNAVANLQSSSENREMGRCRGAGDDAEPILCTRWRALGFKDEFVGSRIGWKDVDGRV
jgi:hypothetical protein